MRIFALEVLFAVGIFSMPAVGSEEVRQDNAPLPQFMPAKARAGLANTRLAADETRKAAEELSAKFSGDQASSPESVATNRQNSAPAPSIADDPRTDAQTSARVAVLRARPSSASSKPKSTRTTATKSNVSKSRSAKSVARSARGSSVDARAKDLTPDPVPGAKLGWQTGVIGMLTNPAFWH